jgi:hypothetical protein
MMDINKIIEWIKLPPRIIGAITVICVITLFTPGNILNKLGILEIRNKYFTWLGIIFIVSSSLLVTHGLSSFYSWLKKKLQLRVSQHIRKKRLYNLTPNEQKILRGYIEKNTHTQTLSIISGIVSGLEAAKIIYRATELSYSGGVKFDYNIQPWAWQYLNTYPELIGIDKKEKVKPTFVKSLLQFRIKL